MDCHSLLQGNFPDPEIEAGSPALKVDYLPSEPPGNPSNYIELVHSAFQVAQLVKNPPAMRETWVRSLGWEDPLEKGKATHSSILVWRIPWTV